MQALAEWIVIFCWLPFKVILTAINFGWNFLFDNKPAYIMEPSKIAKNLVKSVSTGELCRLTCQELSQLKPRLDANNVRFVAIGLEELGVEEFVKGGFFTGEIYIDLKKECYKKLGFRRLNVLTVMSSLMSKSSRNALSESKEKKVGGNMQGDGWQNGGTLVVDKDGNALLTYRQENPSEHVDPNEVLKVLGIEGTIASPTAQQSVECTEDACALPSKS